MTPFRVGIIGTGRPWRTPGATGFGMAHEHVRGYLASPDVALVALCDIVVEKACLFQEEHGGERVYQDYHEMLEKENLDIVSITTWPHLHYEMVIAAAEAGVKAIHCEKPMTLTYGGAKRMIQVCQARGVQLTFNHQRRFDTEFRQARELLKSGVIGKLLRMEAGCPDLFDWGTHWFDMLFFYNDQTPVEWVIGQIEPHGGRSVFDVKHEEQGISSFKFANGVKGLLLTGHTPTWEGYNRLYGEEGVIEVDMTRKPKLRIWGKGMKKWHAIKTEEVDAIKLGILDLIEALKTGRDPELAGRKALNATEMCFATYESARCGGRVELPLQIEDSPIAEILERSK